MTLTEQPGPAPTLQTATTELYGGDPDTFVARRTELAKAARAGGDAAAAREIQQLRRPTRSAWLVNLVARRVPDEVSELMRLGAVLAEAHTGGSATRLRELSARRRAMTTTLMSRAVDLGKAHGYTATDAVRAEAETILDSALVSSEVRDQVLRGIVVAAPALTSAFPLFGGVPAEGSPGPAAGPHPAASDDGDGESDELLSARAALAEASANRQATEVAVRLHDSALDAAHEERDQAAAAVTALRAQLVEAQSTLDEASREVEAARGALSEARSAFDAAVAAEHQAQQTLDQATR